MQVKRPYMTPTYSLKFMFKVLSSAGPVPERSLMILPQPEGPEIKTEKKGKTVLITAVNMLIETGNKNLHVPESAG